MRFYPPPSISVKKYWKIWHAKSVCVCVCRRRHLLAHKGGGNSLPPKKVGLALFASQKGGPNCLPESSKEGLARFACRGSSAESSAFDLVFCTIALSFFFAPKAQKSSLNKTSKEKTFELATPFFPNFCRRWNFSDLLKGDLVNKVTNVLVKVENKTCVENKNENFTTFQEHSLLQLLILILQWGRMPLGFWE